MQGPESLQSTFVRSAKNKHSCIEAIALCKHTQQHLSWSQESWEDEPYRTLLLGGGLVVLLSIWMLVGDTAAPMLLWGMPGILPPGETCIAASWAAYNCYKKGRKRRGWLANPIQRRSHASACSLAPDIMGPVGVNIHAFKTFIPFLSLSVEKLKVIISRFTAPSYTCLLGRMSYSVQCGLFSWKCTYHGTAHIVQQKER